MTEDDLLRAVIDLAHLRGWLVVHHRPARTEKGWRTPTQGDKGVPDLILARRGVVILAELKSDRGRLTLEQMAWRDALGQHWRVWRPADLPRIVEELSART